MKFNYDWFTILNTIIAEKRVYCSDFRHRITLVWSLIHCSKEAVSEKVFLTLIFQRIFYKSIMLYFFFKIICICRKTRNNHIALKFLFLVHMVLRSDKSIINWKSSFLCSLASVILKAFMIDIDTGKIAPILNQMVENEVTQGSLYGI